MFVSNKISAFFFYLKGSKQEGVSIAPLRWPGMANETPFTFSTKTYERRGGNITTTQAISSSKNYRN